MTILWCFAVLAVFYFILYFSLSFRHTEMSHSFPTRYIGFRKTPTFPAVRLLQGLEGSRYLVSAGFSPKRGLEQMFEFG